VCSDQTDELFTQKSGSNPMCKSTQVIVLKSAFFDTLAWGAIAPQSLHLSQAVSPIPVKSP